MWWREVSVFVLVLACSCVHAVSHHDLYTFGASAHDERLLTGDDISTPELQLTTPIVFYGEVYDSIYVNNNGLLSFRTPIDTFLNVEFPLTYPVIAAFYTNVDTRGSGAVFYREARDSTSLSRASLSVQNAFPEYRDFRPSILRFGFPRTVSVNNNGLLSFRTPIDTFLNVEFPLTYPVIAAFYTNVDTRGSGAVFYREARDSTSLSRASLSVQNAFPEYRDFRPSSVFIATWSDVGYHELGADKVNTFQIAIITDGSETFVELVYPQNGIQWIQSQPQVSGLPDARAQAGFVAEDGRYLTLKGSGSEEVRNIVSWSNCGEPGRYVFRVGNIAVDSNVVEPDLPENEVETDDDSQTCAEKGPTACAVRAQCVDFQTGICCQCDDGYYGNGKSCLKSDIPLRVAGKVSGEINGITLDSVDLQAYVVLLDGRTYTALSRVSPELGYDMQTLNILGGAIGWLFAKPANGVSNGYQLTGGTFNHTAVITFPPYDNSVTIRQWFTGHDVFDQLRMEAEIKGTVPFVAPGSTLELPEYAEQYSRSLPGLVLSESIRTFRNKIDGTESKQVIKQSFHFTACKHAPIEEEDQVPVTLKVAKTFIGYESKEGIVRYGMSNKVSPLDQEDPCTRGRLTCVEKSTCVVENDSYQCICLPGYEYSYQNGPIAECVDIDECAIQTHTCDPNARCNNDEGTFTCECNEGYEGNGESCKAISGCSRRACDPNARCYETFGEMHCICNDGFTGDGSRCWLLPDVTCEVLQNCSPYARCVILPHTETYACQCGDAYTGDGYVCSPQTASSEQEPISEGNDFVDPQCMLGYCSCPSGYILSEEKDTCYRNEYTTTIVPEEYNESCDIQNTCHPSATCEPVGDGFECMCLQGYLGDGYTCTEAPSSGVSCENGDMCDVHARCLYDDVTRDRVCVCDHGYKGDGATCTSMADCQHSSDCEENAECRPNHITNRYECICIGGYVKDMNDACIPEGGTCNNAKCAANAICQYDEELGLNYCQCDTNFEGDGINDCRPLERSCNIVNDCGLNAFCDYDFDQALYECRCVEGYYGDGYSCTSIATCENDPHMCSLLASCVQRHNSFVCECNPGFNGNGSVCTPAPRHEGDLLLIAQNLAVLRVPLSPSARDIGRPIQISHNQMAIGLDIDCIAGRVYWSDIAGRVIKSSNYMGLMQENFLTEDIYSPEGISIDWIARNIFWTDSRKDTIEVASLDSRIRKVLVNTGLVNPRGIAVHPSRGKIFWSDWNRESPKIEWANMDGSGRAIFLKDNFVILPNSLAIDWDTDALCFADAGSKKIECVHIDTLQRQTISNDCSYPFGLSVTNTHYYWTDWNEPKIEVVEKETLERKKSLSVPLGATGKMYGMASVPNECLHLSSPCYYNNGNCPAGHLCLPNGMGGRTCVCGTPLSGPKLC